MPQPADAASAEIRMSASKAFRLSVPHFLLKKKVMNIVAMVGTTTAISPLMRDSTTTKTALVVNPTAKTATAPARTSRTVAHEMMALNGTATIEMLR